MAKRSFDILEGVDVARLAKRPGMHSDGRGLYLKVMPTGGASWVLRYMLDGKAHTMGLGGYPGVSLSEARTRRNNARLLKQDGVDPIAAARAIKAAEKAKQAAEEAALNPLTFEKVAKEFLLSKSAGWKDSGKTSGQWAASLRDWVYPKIGQLPIQSITPDNIISVLRQDVDGKPFWEAKAETASRCRQRIENILDYAKAREYRSGDNPAEWARLKFVLPKRSAVADVEHHPSLPHHRIADFVKALRAKAATSRAASALEFTILTAARSAETRGMTWGEVDLEKAEWSIPAKRMKGKKPHRVPLCARAVQILTAARGTGPAPDRDDLVFPGTKPGRPLSDMTMAKVIKTMNKPKEVWVDLDGAPVTVHGFRSTFSTWAREETSFPTHHIEVSLAHTVGNEVERAYGRTDYFGKRLELMEAWARYAGGNVGGNVHVLKAAV